MAAINIHVEGVARVLAALDRMSPAKQPKFVSDFLETVVFSIQDRVARETIARSSKGPVLADKITRRTGRGPDSVSVDREALPFSITIGSDVGYMALHEEGGDVSVRGSIISEHVRRVAFGKRRKPFTVPSYYRSAHGATYPARPWLRPAIALVEPTIEAILERAMTAQLDTV